MRCEIFNTTLGYNIGVITYFQALQLSMSEKCEYAISRIWHFAAFFAYFSKVRISHIFLHILAFSAALNIVCSYFSNFRIYPISGFAADQYSLLSEHGRR